MPSDGQISSRSVVRHCGQTCRRWGFRLRRDRIRPTCPQGVALGISLWLDPKLALDLGEPLYIWSSESVSSLKRILPWTRTTFLVAAVQEFIKLPPYKISLSVQSILQFSHRLSIDLVMIVQQSLNQSLVSFCDLFLQDPVAKHSARHWSESTGHHRIWLVISRLPVSLLISHGPVDPLSSNRLILFVIPRRSS